MQELMDYKFLSHVLHFVFVIMFVVKEMFFSPIKREIVIIAEGDLPSLTANAMTAFASGAFEDTTFEPLITTEEMVEAMKTAQQIAGRYNTPNQDEIDRMLLEE